MFSFSVDYRRAWRARLRLLWKARWGSQFMDVCFRGWRSREAHGASSPRIRRCRSSARGRNGGIGYCTTRNVARKRQVEQGPACRSSRRLCDRWPAAFRDLAKSAPINAESRRPVGNAAGVADCAITQSRLPVNKLSKCCDRYQQGLKTKIDNCERPSGERFGTSPYRNDNKTSCPSFAGAASRSLATPGNDI